MSGQSIISSHIKSILDTIDSKLDDTTVTQVTLSRDSIRLLVDEIHRINKKAISLLFGIIKSKRLARDLSAKLFFHNDHQLVTLCETIEKTTYNSLVDDSFHYYSNLEYTLIKLNKKLNSGDSIDAGSDLHLEISRLVADYNQ